MDNRKQGQKLSGSDQDKEADIQKTELASWFLQIELMGYSV